MGPFYCPADRSVYIDLAFYRLLQERFKAPGDFAQAYVIAHEVGHHVQNLLGIMDKVQASRPRLSEAQNNALSVRVELQADCFAGVWAHHAQRSRQVLEQGDIEEALRAATAIGDDTLQRKHPGHDRARVLHARQRGPAHALVPPRLRGGDRRRLQHVRHADALGARP